MDILREAKFSECGLYRYYLRRLWNESLDQCLVVMYNPSTANNVDDDPTIKRLIKDLQWLGYGGFYVVNLYAHITSKPERLFDISDPIKDNDYYLAHAALATQVQIFAWGDFPKTEYRAKKMLQLFPDALCFGHNESKSPWHPMRMQRSGMRTEDVQLIKYKS